MKTLLRAALTRIWCFAILLASVAATPSFAGSVTTISTVTIPAAIFTGATVAAQNAAVIGPQSFVVAFSNTFGSTNRIAIEIDLANANFANQSFTITTTGSAAVSASTVCTSISSLNNRIFLDGCQAASGQTITGLTFANVTYKDAVALATVGSSIFVSGSIVNANNTAQGLETITSTAVVTSTTTDNPNAAAASTFSIVSATSTTEAAGTVDLTVTRGGVTSTSVTINYATVAGTATAATDFTAKSGTLTFAAGETSKTITIAILKDSVAEGPETFTVVLSSPSANTSIATGSGTATVTIATDQASGGAIIINVSTVTIPSTLFTTSATAAKNAVVIGPQSFLLQFLNTYQAGTRFSLELDMSNGSFASQTFTATSAGSVTVSAATFCAATTVLATKVFIDNCAVPAGATISGMTFAGMTYKDAAALAVIGSSIFIDGYIYNASNPSQIFETIGHSPVVTSQTSDDPNAAAATISVPATATVKANAGSVSLTATRTNILTNAVTVSYATQNGTAASGTNYTAATGTLSFAANETSKTVTVPILNNTAQIANTTFMVTLSNVSSGAAIGNATSTVTITPGTVPLTSDSYAVVAPVFSGADGNLSFIRLANYGAVPRTISVKVVGTPSGALYGSTEYAVPSSASPQIAMSDIVSKSGSGALRGGDVGYALYLSQETGMAFQHVVWNTTSGLFENLNACAYPNAAINYTALSRQLLNVHTSVIPDYPAYVTIHNAYNQAQNYTADVYDAATGAKIGSATIQVGANSTVTQPFSALETQMGWKPAANQFHVNIFFGVSGVTSPQSFYGVLSNYILNKRLNGYTNMTGWCSTAGG